MLIWALEAYLNTAWTTFNALKWKYYWSSHVKLCKRANSGCCYLAPFSKAAPLITAVWCCGCSFLRPTVIANDSHSCQHRVTCVACALISSLSRTLTNTTQFGSRRIHSVFPWKKEIILKVSRWVKLIYSLALCSSWGEILLCVLWRTETQ